MKIPKLPWWGWTLGAIVVAGGVMLYTKRKKAKAPAGSGALPAAAAPATAAGSAAYNPYTDPAFLAQQNQQQQQQGTASIVSAIQGLAGPAGTPGAGQAPGFVTPPYTGESYVGGGYDVPAGMFGFTDTQGNAYERFPNWAAAYEYVAQQASAGKPAGLFYQPAPGQAQPANVNALVPWTTPLYSLVPQTPAAIGQQAAPTLTPGYPANL